MPQFDTLQVAGKPPVTQRPLEAPYSIDPAPEEKSEYEQLSGPTTSSWNAKTGTCVTTVESVGEFCGIFTVPTASGVVFPELSVTVNVAAVTFPLVSVVSWIPRVYFSGMMFELRLSLLGKRLLVAEFITSVPQFCQYWT